MFSLVKIQKYPIFLLMYDDARLRFQSVHFPSAEQKRALLVRIELQDNHSGEESQVPIISFEKHSNLFFECNLE